MILEGARRASAAGTAGGPRPDSAAAFPPPGLTPRGLGTSAAPRGGRAGAEPVQRRRADVAQQVTCRICGGLLRDATAISECLHTFCRNCIYDKVEKEGIKCCPTCGTHLGSAPKEKLRSVIFPAKRRKKINVITANNKKRKEKVCTESTLSSVVDMVTEGSTAALPPASSQIEEQNIEVEVIDEADESLAQESVNESSILNLAPVGRDVLSKLSCRDFCSSCHLSGKTGALILWQPPPILEEMIALDQLPPRQDPETFKPTATSDAEHQRQVPTVHMTKTSVVAGTSFHARMTVEDENLMGGFLTMLNEERERIMGSFVALVSQLKADNSKTIEKLEHETAAALEKTRILEQERTATAERTRILEERLQRALENQQEDIRILESRSQSLEAEKAKLYEELENVKAESLKKSDAFTELKNYSDMLVSDKKDLENKLKNLTKELGNAKKDHAKSVFKVLDTAKEVMRQLGRSTLD